MAKRQTITFTDTAARDLATLKQHMINTTGIESVTDNDVVRFALRHTAGTLVEKPAIKPPAKARRSR